MALGQPLSRRLYPPQHIVRPHGEHARRPEHLRLEDPAQHPEVYEEDLGRVVGVLGEFDELVRIDLVCHRVERD